MQSTLQRPRRRTGCGSVPTRRTHNRCTIGGMIGNNACGSRALAYGRTVRQRRRARRADRDGRPASGWERAATSELGVGAGARPRCAGSWSPTWRRSAPSSAASAARCPATRWSTCCRSAGSTSPAPWSAARARWPSSSAPPCAWCADPPARVLVVARLPRHGRRRRRRPGVLPHRPDRVRGPGLPHRRRGARRPAAAPCPPCRAGDGWLFVELAGDDRRRARAPAPTAGRRRAARSTRLVVTDPAAGGRPVADPRGRRRAGRRAPRRAARRTPGGRTPRCPPRAARRLPARLRRAAGRARPDGVPYGHFGDGCVHVRIDFPLDRAAAATAGLPRLPATTRRGWSAGYGGSHVRRARRRPRPQRAAAADVLRRGARACSPRSRPCSTPRTCSTPACSCDPAPLDADLRSPRPRRTGRASRWPTRTTAATSPRRCTAAPASASAAPTPPPPAG